MRLVFVSNFFPPHDRGGFEKHCSEVARGLAFRGHHITILTSRYRNPSVPARAADAAESSSTGKVLRSLYLEADLEHYNPLHFFTHRSIRDIHNSKMLLQVVGSEKPDIVVFWGMWNLSRNLPALAERTGVPVAYWLGDTWPLDDDLHTRYWRELLATRYGWVIMKPVIRLALHMLDKENYPPSLAFSHVACGSQFIKRKTTARIPVFANAQIVTCGTDLNMFSWCQPHTQLFSAASPRFVYVGGLGPHKGVHTAIKAMAHLKVMLPDTGPILTIVGSGHSDYQMSLRHLAVQLGVTDNIHYTGAVPPTEIPAILSRHDILIAPSVIEEGFGRVVVEAMAAGLVVVGTATGGTAEILKDQINGLVFRAEDARGLAMCLQELIISPQLYPRLAAQGRKTSKQFDLESMVGKMESFLFDVVSTRHDDQ